MSKTAVKDTVFVPKISRGLQWKIWANTTCNRLMSDNGFWLWFKNQQRTEFDNLNEF